MRCQIAVEGMQRSQTLVASLRLVVALKLDHLQELQDPLRRQVGQCEPGDWLAAGTGNEGEKQLDRVAVALDGPRTQPLLHLQVVLEEAEQHLSDGAHGWPRPGVNARNLRSASRSSSSVTVRYTAVDAGSAWPRNVDSWSRRTLGSMPERYQRSKVSTAKVRRRSCSRGAHTPA